jgi:hypothetical protein
VSFLSAGYCISRTLCVSIVVVVAGVIICFSASWDSFKVA